MTEDPYHSPLPVVNAIAGISIALLMFVPVVAVTTDRVKSIQETKSDQLTGELNRQEEKEANIRRLTQIQ